MQAMRMFYLFGFSEPTPLQGARVYAGRFYPICASALTLHHDQIRVHQGICPCPPHHGTGRHNPIGCRLC